MNPRTSRVNVPLDLLIAQNVSGSKLSCRVGTCGGHWRWSGRRMGTGCNVPGFLFGLPRVKGSHHAMKGTPIHQVDFSEQYSQRYLRVHCKINISKGSWIARHSGIYTLRVNAHANWWWSNLWNLFLNNQCCQSAARVENWIKRSWEEAESLFLGSTIRWISHNKRVRWNQRRFSHF